jgi:hypothetical protein
LHERVNANYRNHPLRLIQSALQNLTPGIVEFMHHRQLLDNTPIAEALSQGGNLHPDQLTLAGLQITIEAGEALANGATYEPMARMILGGAFDLFDGSLARCLKSVSPEGAVKDVLADRIAELHVAQLIGNIRNKHENDGVDLSELKIAFPLSTLTKAASEMLGVRTSEGGQGGMIERRKKLLLILYNLGKINVVYIMKEKEKLDVVGSLNEIAGGRMFFPSGEDLSRRYKYIDKCLENIKPFLGAAFSLG